MGNAIRKRARTIGARPGSKVRRRGAVVVLIALAVAAATASPALSAGADVNAGRLSMAEGTFSIADATNPCLVTQTMVRLISFIGNEDGANPRTAFVDVVILQLDDCSGTVDSVSYGFTEVTAPSFDFAGNGLAGATLSATLDVCDRDEQFACVAGTTRPVAVDLMWSGFGEPGSFDQHQINLAPGSYMQLSVEAGAGRAANVGGSILDGAMNLAAVGTVGDLQRAEATFVNVFTGPPSQRP